MKARLVRARVPEGKCVLNTHVSIEEKQFLRDVARRERMTVTMVLRLLIQQARRRTQR